MNAPHTLQQQLALSQPGMATVAPEEDGIHLAEYWDIIVDNRWLISGVTALAVALGAAYALLAKPVYESNLLIQVEDSASGAKSFLGEAASLFDVKTPATAEIEILRSRMVVGQAVDSTLLYIDARPRYLPVVGEWLARRAKGLSNPGLFGIGGWVTGAEKLAVQTFDVPKDLEGSRFRLESQSDGGFKLGHAELGEGVVGRVGTPLVANTSLGPVTLLVRRIEANAGAEFELARYSRLKVIEELQENLRLAEKGRQSGVIDVVLQDTDRQKLTRILDAVGQQYVRQNIERKAAEAQKTLSFLDDQLPQFKKQLDQSEETYSKYRNQQGTVALDEEAKLILTRSVELQTKLLEAQQRRRDLVSRFTAVHPNVRTLDEQIAAWGREISGMNTRIKGLPTVQQDTVRLERDVKVNNELYQKMRNEALQLQLIREGKIGNVRIIDPASAPEDAVKPRRGLALGLALLIGLVGGILTALARNAFLRGIRSAQEIEANSGLNVYSTIPESKLQLQLAGEVAAKSPGLHVLAFAASDDPAIESLRSLRTALQFGMLEAANNRVLITGPTPGVGKSFISVNFAAILAGAGKRVLLIDADLRKGYLNHYFGLPRGKGLSEVVAGSISAAQAIHCGVLPNLDLLSTGVLPPNPADLMMSAAFTQLLNFLSPQYDLVIIDTPPVLVAADTVAVAPQAGTVLLVARADRTLMGELHESAKRLSHAGKAVTGVLFNGLDITRRHFGSHAYRYGGYQYRNYRYQQDPS